MRVRGDRVAGAATTSQRRPASPQTVASPSQRQTPAAAGAASPQRSACGSRNAGRQAVRCAPAGVVGLEAPRRGGAPTAPGPGRPRRRRPGRAARRARPRARARARPPRPAASGARSRGPGRRPARPRRSARRRRRRARRRRGPPRRPRARRSSRPRRRPPGARGGGASVPAPPHASAPAPIASWGRDPNHETVTRAAGDPHVLQAGAVPQRSPACAGGSRDSLIASSP